MLSDYIGFKIIYTLTMWYFTGNYPYPPLDDFHQHCSLSVILAETSCQHAFDTVKDTVETWHPEPMGNGIYKIWDATEMEMVWATRNYAVNSTDDVMFEFFGNPENFREKHCEIHAKSRDQISGIEKDAGRNYCNIYNVISLIPNANIKEGPGGCSHIPSDPKAECG